MAETSASVPLSSQAVQTIRPLDAEDLPRLVKLAPELIDEFHGWRTSCDVDRMLAQWHALYASGAGIAYGLFEDNRLVGSIGGFSYQDMYDGVQTTADLGWFVQKASRRGIKPILLLRMLEQWAKEKASKRITFTKIVDPSDPDGPIHDLKGLGYAPRQVVYGKHL